MSYAPFTCHPLAECPSADQESVDYVPWGHQNGPLSDTPQTSRETEIRVFAEHVERAVRFHFGPEMSCSVAPPKYGDFDGADPLEVTIDGIVMGVVCPCNVPVPGILHSYEHRAYEVVLTDGDDCSDAVVAGSHGRAILLILKRQFERRAYSWWQMS